MTNIAIKNDLEAIKKTALVFDTETCASYPDGKPIDIKKDFENYVRYAKIKWFGAYSYKHQKGYCLNVRTDFNKIFDLLFEHDVLVHFNGNEFDFPILINNQLINTQKKYIHIDCLEILGTSNQRNKDGYKYKNRAELMDYKLKGNSLRSMAEVMELGTLKGEIDYKIFFKNEWTEEETTQIKEYLKADVLIVKQMFDKLWNYWLPFAELLDNKNIYNLSWIKSSIASLTYKAACKVLNTEPTYSDKGTTIEEMGGNVLEPKIEEANSVWYVDFASLYPHCISMFNLVDEVDEETPYAWHGNELFKVKGYYDVSTWHPLSKYIADKLKERLYLKETDPKNPMVYTLKILLNGLYGVIRSAIFEKVHTPNAGWDTCFLGQQIQQLTINMMKEFEFEEIYGDTDSAFFITNDKEKNNREYVLQCLNKIIEKIKNNVPFPVDTFKINIEHYLEYVLFPFEEQPVIDLETGKNKKEGNRLILERKGKKKNYLFVYQDKGEKKVKLIGLPIKKDNATALGIKIYNEVLEPLILQNNSAKFQKAFIEEIINNYLKRPEIMELLSQEYKVNAASTYKLDSQIQAQISKGYFNGEGGVIRLVKNTKVGKAGKGMLYATVQEIVDAKLSIEDIDLEKVWQELSPFIKYEEKMIKEACKILAKDDKALQKLSEDFLKEEPKKRGRPRKVDNGKD